MKYRVEEGGRGEGAWACSLDVEHASIDSAPPSTPFAQHSRPTSRARREVGEAR
jgi:hypothetical protein